MRNDIRRMHMGTYGMTSGLRMPDCSGGWAAAFLQITAHHSVVGRGFQNDRNDWLLINPRVGHDWLSPERLDRRAPIVQHMHSVAQPNVALHLGESLPKASRPGHRQCLRPAGQLKTAGREAAGGYHPALRNLQNGKELFK